jgi:hypothetical protein
VSIAARLKRLEQARGVGACDGRPLSVVLNDDPIPAGTRRCPRCGSLHVLRLRLVVVEPHQARGQPA